MLENSPAIRPSSGGHPPVIRHGSGSPPPASRSRSTNDPRYLLPKQPNPRALDRRRRDLITAFVNALGPSGVNDLTLLMVRKAVELTVAAEMARAAMLNGVPTDMLALVRLEGVAARAVRLLGLRVEAPPPRARGLELARQRWAEDAERERKAKAKAKATEAGDGR